MEKLLQRAWRRHTGWVCISVRDPSKGKDEPGYWEDKFFRWPRDKDKIAELVQRNAKKKDVYWAPALYRKPKRDKRYIKPITTLWADLDEVAPDQIPGDLKPTAVWETSDGRWQGLWELTDELEPSVQTELNKRLTYALGADKGGWDLTQVLRVPGTPNHKYDDQTVGKAHINGTKPISPIDLLKLPDAGALPTNGDTADLRIEPVPQVLKRFKIPARAKALLRTKEAPVGTRSERLWELECLLAEAGMGVDEIVSVVRPSAWNKHREKSRSAELKTLAAEARKAVAQVKKGRRPTVSPEPVTATPSGSPDAEDELPRLSPLSLPQFDRDHKPIRWLVADVWGEGEVGFISGPPKSYKSWISLDLAYSAATGERFLDSFQSKKVNVLLVQEEDPKVVMQDRLIKVAAAKGHVWAKPGKGVVEMRYSLPTNLFIISSQGFQISEEYLEMLEQIIIEKDIKLLILDPLMMMADGDEFKAFEMMNNILKPLKQLRARTQAAIVVVHHHVKNAGSGGHSDAAKMYGSVAFWAWEEAALHLHVVSPGRVGVERFSKHSQLTQLTISVGDTQEEWHPAVREGVGSDDDIVQLLATYEAGATIEEIIDQTGLNRDAVSRMLKALAAEGKIDEENGPRTGAPGRPKKVWKVKR